MSIKELREKKTETLVRELEELEVTLRGLRFQVSSSQLSNVRKVRVIRQQIAQIKTILRQRVLES
ncbi:MAG: 50S ribosomal protein L29 [Candidatus Uhrbacteria bacterium GW2011_GWE2_40_58]|nr:MAG: 50S ribosomal protein L29 [Candidatus Uhrbacteria bacterium GW2011_GWF2_40_263]KKR67516.1 MAG: 50S ribosomal protein L29 [Candidatus Uhrbacteria bacterium GW2011_GWE2_40_58]OGL93705.1 MAG: 50S ribosomal protein L29 [Candidatus Uhrbacteria bacterium RIFOXYA2_FULL_40_9]OGL96442.1 MAG: 50S ribosomal protein L29 [Candidatus Uhrbacteria bacterium RIFOXYB2_FULL_41_18]HBK34850.1 50S ribosomal protein L29 [Candidatus Uhrbacteria bacterium]